jgi:hypothetical protein
MDSACSTHGRNENLSWKPCGKWPHGRRSCKWKRIKIGYKEDSGTVDLFNLLYVKGWGIVYREHGKDPQGSIKSREFCDILTDYQISQKDSATMKYFMLSHKDIIYFIGTSCTCVNNSHVKTVK